MMRPLLRTKDIVFMMSVKLRDDQCCSTDKCKKPRRHADLCTSCYMSSSAAIRAVCDLEDVSSLPLAQVIRHFEQPTVEIDVKAVAELAMLEDWWAISTGGSS